MLRAVFLGSKNAFDDILVHWLAQRTELVGVVWTKSTAWQSSWRGRIRFARRRLRRYGLRKAVDETLFYAYYHSRLYRRDAAELERVVIRPYVARHGIPAWQGDAIHAENVNEPRVLGFLRACRPDVAFAMCISNYFRSELRAIPRLGVYLWHEGITPEYKGLYAPFWAVHNLDFARIGYTLLRMGDGYDDGHAFVQGPASGVDPFQHHHIFIGHKAIMDSLPDVERFLVALEAGEARPLDRAGAVPAMYTYPGISDLIRQRMRLRRAARRGGRSDVAPA